jgi:hypothetical protein
VAQFWQMKRNMEARRAPLSHAVPNGIRIHRLCPVCPDRQGVLVFTGHVATSTPDTPYHHRCDVCGAAVWLESIYPQQPDGTPCLP